MTQEQYTFESKPVDRFASIAEIIDAQFLLVKTGGAGNMQVYGELSWVVEYEPKAN